MKVDEITKVYAEERDCGASTFLPEFNQLRVRTVNNGIGSYLVIDTQRWALDDDNLEELFLELRNLLREVNYERPKV